MSLGPPNPVEVRPLPALDPPFTTGVQVSASLGARLEGHAVQFLENATDFAVLGGMTAGMGTYRSLKHFGLARIFPGGKLPRRLGSAALGFCGEVPAFLLTEKAIGQVMGAPQDWSPATLLEEGKSLGLNLFFLKGSHSIHPSFISAVAGLTLADQVDGLRRGLKGRPLLDSTVDSTVFALQFTLSGRFLQAGLNPKLQRTWMRLATEAQGPERETGNLFHWSFPLAWANAGFGTNAPEFAKPVFLKSSGPTSSGESPKGSPSFQQALAKKLGVSQGDPLVHRIVKNVEDTRLFDKQSYRDLILRVNIYPGEWKFPLGDEFRVPPERVLERATRRIQWATTIQAFQRIQGTYFEYLLQVAVEDAVTTQNGRALQGILNVAGGQPTMEEVESVFRLVKLREPYELPDTIDLRETPVGRYWEREIDRWKFWTGTNMDAERHLLKKYFSILNQPGRVPERLGSRNKLSLPSGEVLWLTPRNAMEALQRLQEDHFSDINQKAGWVLTQATQSPIPMLVVDRLIKILCHQKFNNERFSSPQLWELLQRKGLDYDYLAQAKKYQAGPSIFTGFLNSQEVADRIGFIYREVPNLLMPQEARKRRAAFEAKVEDLLDLSGGYLGPTQIIELLRFNPTPRSLEAAKLLVSRALDLKMVDRKTLGDNWEEPGSQVPEAILIPPQDRAPGDPARPLILILDPVQEGLNREERVRSAIRLPESVVHEVSHYLRDYSPNGEGVIFRDKRGKLIGEFLAHLEHEYYALQQGYFMPWLEGESHPLGFPALLRARLEQKYL